MSEEKKTWGKRESRIIVTLFIIVVAALSLMSAWEQLSPRIFGNALPVEDGGRCGIVFWRNRRIDKLEAEIQQNENSDYTGGEINAAVDCIKAHFKEKKNNVSLLRLLFSEKECNAVRDGCNAAEKFGKNNVIVLLCDYTVYESLGTVSKGTYKNWAMILSRKTKNEPWSIFDQGY